MWADALYIEATLPTAHHGGPPDYWMKGSVYRGRGFDAAALYTSNWNWIDHLNGNAFYRLNDPEFEDFVRITKVGFFEGERALHTVFYTAFFFSFLGIRAFQRLLETF